MENATIDNLKKVSLNVNIGRDPGDGGPEGTFVFIYGVGSTGVTPFEKALFGKQVGDCVAFDMAAAGACESLGHLEKPLAEQTGIVAPGYLTVTITDIKRAEDREVVQAMAGGGSCSDCGCGCGAH